MRCTTPHATADMCTGVVLNQAGTSRGHEPMRCLQKDKL